MSDDRRMTAPLPGSSHVNFSSATLIVPPRPALPPQPAPSPRAPLPVPPAAETPVKRERPAGFWPRVLLGAYLFVLTVIALWPVPVDSGAGPAIGLVSRVFPVFTYARIEFGANILLFVPFGVLLALILRHRYLIVPIAFLATVAIESMQALLIDKRTPTVMDIIANLTGACLGLVIVALVEGWRSRRA